MSIPVILVGITIMMGSKVAPRLRPEFEVIQFISSAERARSEIPILQAGQAPVPDPQAIGTHDFSRKPEVVLFGRGFDGSAVEELFEACNAASSSLVWLRSADEDVALIKTKPPSEHDGGVDGYADAIAKLTKKSLFRIKDEGKWGKGAVYTYSMRQQ